MLPLHLHLPPIVCTPTEERLEPIPHSDRVQSKDLAADQFQRLRFFIKAIAFVMLGMIFAFGTIIWVAMVVRQLK